MEISSVGGVKQVELVIGYREICMGRFLSALLGLCLTTSVLFSHEEPEDRARNLEFRLSSQEGELIRLRSQLHDEYIARIFTSLFLTGAFRALWAQNTGRNAWVWFFLGFLFRTITVLVLLRKNATDRPEEPEHLSPEGPRVNATPTGDGKKICGGCGEIVNLYAVRCFQCKGVFGENTGIENLRAGDPISALDQNR